jgi:hypothetical protein
LGGPPGACTLHQPSTPRLTRFEESMGTNRGPGECAYADSLRSSYCLKGTRGDVLKSSSGALGLGCGTCGTCSPSPASKGSGPHSPPQASDGRRPSDSPELSAAVVDLRQRLHRPLRDDARAPRYPWPNRDEPSALHATRLLNTAEAALDSESEFDGGPGAALRRPRRPTASESCRHGCRPRRRPSAESKIPRIRRRTSDFFRLGPGEKSNPPGLQGLPTDILF